MNRLIFRRSRAKTAVLLLGALAFVVGGVFMGRLADTAFDRAMGWACVAFFGLIAVSGTVRMFRDDVVFALDESGITDEAKGVVIPWEEIEEVVVVTISGARFLGLTLRRPEQFLARVSAAERGIAGVNERMGWGHWGFSFAGISPGIDQALEFIHRKVPGVRTAAS